MKRRKLKLPWGSLILSAALLLALAVLFGLLVKQSTTSNVAIAGSTGVGLMLVGIGLVMLGMIAITMSIAPDVSAFRKRRRALKEQRRSQHDKPAS